MNGKAENDKARLVAKGFDRKGGINYCETYSPTVGFESIRVMVAAAAKEGMHNISREPWEGEHYIKPGHLRSCGDIAMQGI